MLQVPIAEGYMMATMETTLPDMGIQTTQVMISNLSTKEKCTNGNRMHYHICILTAKFIES